MSAAYVVYKGDKIVCMGTAAECAEALGVSERTIRWYASPACHRRAERMETGSHGSFTVAERVVA